MRDNTRTGFIIGNCFSYLGREWLRALAYAVLAFVMICNILYLDIVFKNYEASRFNFSNLQGADYVLFDVGDYLKKINNPENFYQVIKKKLPEGSYALAPWLLVKDGDYALFATDEPSLAKFDWKIEWGQNFSNYNHNEVIAFKGAANLGDVVTFTFRDEEHDFSETCEFEVVGIYDSDQFPVAQQIASDRIRPIFFRYNDYIRDLNYVTDNYKGFIINPEHDWAGRGRYDAFASGVFITGGIADNGNTGYNDSAEQLVACNYTGSNVTVNNTRWTILVIIKALLIIIAFVAFMCVEAFLRFKKYSWEFKIWNYCGMSKNEIKRTYTQIFALPFLLGTFAGFIAYIFEFNKYTGKLWALGSIAFCIIIFAIFQHIVNNKIFEKNVNLVPNEEKEFIGNRADASFPLMMKKTVRYNLRIPIELMKMDEEAVHRAVDRSLGIGYINYASELKCKDLNDYEILRVKIARALTVLPKKLFIGSEWHRLNEMQKKELGAFISHAQQNWGIEVIFAPERIEAKK